MVPLGRAADQAPDAPVTMTRSPGRTWARGTRRSPTARWCCARSRPLGETEQELLSRIAGGYAPRCCPALNTASISAIFRGSSAMFPPIRFMT